MSALPAFLLNTDEEEAEDLAVLGIDLNRPMSEPEIDAAASEMLGRMAWYERQIAEAAEAERLEVERIHARYDRRIEPLKARRAHYEEQVIILAQRAQYDGKKKSHAVGNGTFGKRKSAEKVAIIDADAALVFAKSLKVDTVVKVKESVVHAAITPYVLTRLHETGELPEGFEHHAETETYYAKVEV